MGSAPADAVALHDHLLPADHRAPQRLHDRLGEGLGDLHERKALGDLDRADVLRADLGLVADGAHEVSRADARRAPGTDEDPRGAAGLAPARLVLRTGFRAGRRSRGDRRNLMLLSLIHISEPTRLGMIS